MKRELLPAPKLVGGIRVSPDGRFVAFGVDEYGDLSETHLRICELNLKACMDGPKYTEWIAGKETYWTK